MDPELFRRFSELAYEKAGIYLNAGKEALVTARVAKRQRVLGIDDPRDYLALLESKGSTDELLSFLDAISTNYTSFFREIGHFEFLARIVNQWIREGQKRFRFWSAACSSGEEPYSMTMTLLEDCRAASLDFKILATDLSAEVLARARTGHYTEYGVRSVPEPLLRRHFDASKKPEARGERLFAIKPNLQEHIVFKRFNLAATPYPMSGPLDLIFCRNVMIYFDNAVRGRLVDECERLLKPGGFLLTGHSETLTALDTRLEAVEPSVYQKRNGR